ncbi:unnamed protein product, partial [marine sediment metagenome]
MSKMVWYEVSPETPDSAPELTKAIKEQRLMTRHLNSTVYACIGPQHQYLLAEIAKKFGASISAI